jgi:hypothetical protein
MGSDKFLDGLDWLFERCEQRGVRITSVMRDEARRCLVGAGLPVAAQ